MQLYTVHSLFYQLDAQVMYYTPVHVSSTIIFIFRRTIVLVQHHRLREDSRNLWSQQSPKESDDTRCCTNTIVLLKMSTVVLETCRGV